MPTLPEAPGGYSASGSWDPGVISGGTVSNSNLTFTSTGVGYVEMSRTITGPTYAEFTLQTITGTPSIGVVGRNWSGNQHGTDATSVGYLSTGAVKYNGLTLMTMPTYTAGDRIDIAVDFSNRLIWFRKNNGSWNNSGTADPATGAGGLSFATTTSNIAFIGTALFGAFASASGTVWLVAAAGSFADTPPSGFVAIDTQQIVLARSADKTGAWPVVALTTTTIARTAFMPDGDRALRAFAPAGTITVVSGTTKENGSLVGSRRVDVYDRNTGELLGTTLSDGSGNWSVPCLGRPAVRVVGSDPTTYDSIVHDNVVPV